MNRISLIVILFFLQLFSFGQTQKIKGSIHTTDTARLVILNVYPDSFPAVSVVFKAETNSGNPVWNLSKEKMTARENGIDCKVVSVNPISKNKALNLGIVIDHSGSMMGHGFIGVDNLGKKYYLINGIITNELPKGYVFHSPIDDAKKAVKKFVQTFNAKKDSVSIIGFSEQVDSIVPLTQNISLINKVVDSMDALGSTAFYDAMLKGLEAIKGSNSVPVLIAMTDGMDNASVSTYKDVITKAKQLDIPVYIVGLGNVNKDTLQLIANSTNGQFYYTETSGSLETIYAKISKQLQAFYNLVYLSDNFSSADSSRQIALSFDVDSIYLETAAYKKEFPGEVLAYIASKQKQKEYLLYGSIVVIVLVSVGTLLYYRRKKAYRAKPVITKLFPNPSNGIVHIDFVSNGGELQIVTLQGTLVKTIALSGSSLKLDLTALTKGAYIAVIKTNGVQSNPVEFIIQ